MIESALGSQLGEFCCRTTISGQKKALEILNYNINLKIFKYINKVIIKFEFEQRPRKLPNNKTKKGLE